MKYLISFITILLFSCNNDTVTIKKEEYNNLKGISEYPKSLKIGNHNSDRGDFIIELSTDGHDYAHNYNSSYYAYVAFHYIECKKCESNKNLKLLQFPKIVALDTHYFVRAPRKIRELPIGHPFLIRDTMKWLNEIVKPAILNNKLSYETN